MNDTFAVNRGNAPYDAEGQNNNVSVGYVGSTPDATVAARQESAGGYDYTATGNALPGGVLNLLPGANDVGAPNGKDGAKQAGYIWSAALRHGLSVRNYGFFSDNSHYGLTAADPGYANPIEFSFAANARQMWVTNPELIPVADNYFRGFDEACPDNWRYEEFEREFNLFAAPNNDLSNLALLRLMRDHMRRSSSRWPGQARRKPSRPTTTWRSVGRSTCWRVAGSPRTAATNGCAPQHGLTVNVVRTIEDVLGLEHLNLNTAYQRPMTDVFDISGIM